MKKIIRVALTLCLLVPTAFLGAKPAPPVEARCPRVHEAAHALEVALQEMDHASWDYCGHKAEAMEATRHALEQLRRAEQCKDCGDRR
ncbi:MAG TPA: hypothetical protein VIX19_00795 [Terriglobales bacterium]